MTQAEKIAVREVLMQLLMQGGEVSTTKQPTLGKLKTDAGCGRVEFTRDGFVAIKGGLDANRRVITEKGKQFILDMDADKCPSPKEET